MRILVTGSGSQLTAPLTTLLAARGHTSETASHAELDICDLEADRAAVAGFDTVVNLAAANSVDACEADPMLAYDGNCLGPMQLARAAREAGATMVHFSTDFVHGGLESPPEYYVEATPPAPVNVYGHSKQLGEAAVAAAGGRHYVLRTSWVIGDRFVGYVRDSIEKGKLQIPPVGHACPAVAADLVAVTVRLLEADAPSGLYNVANPPATDRPALLRTLVSLLGGDPDIVVLGEDTRPAARPTHSALGVDKLAGLGLHMPAWQDSLQRYLSGEPSSLHA